MPDDIGGQLGGGGHEEYHPKCGTGEGHAFRGTSLIVAFGRHRSGCPVGQHSPVVHGPMINAVLLSDSVGPVFDAELAIVTATSATAANSAPKKPASLIFLIPSWMRRGTSLPRRCGGEYGSDCPLRQLGHAVYASRFGA
ncbi:hypothetical protein [Lentzea sp. E54]|uniref:hypothetical protein n=1 Tax=Lentzea xerophila TaxID=3435883 RepID=UPI003DA3F3A4